VTARRIVAVLAAIVLIGGALLVRNAIDDDDADAGGPTGSTVTATTQGTDAGAFVCSSELAAACTAIAAAHPDADVTVEPAGTTLDRLAALPDGTEPPVWLTVAPYPAMVDALRDAAGLQPFGGTADVLAATPLVVATPIGGRADVLASGCAETPLWRCIGDHASAPWTDIGGEESWHTLRPSLGLVETDATALGSFATAVAGYLGTPSVTSSAWESDPAFIPWLRRLAGAVSPAALSLNTPLDTMTTRAGALDIAATSGAASSGPGAPADRFVASYPEPSMWMDAVLAVPDGIAIPDDVDVIATDALDGAGWDGPDTATQHLPGASTMLALRAFWQEATT
jgi:hypothetical protein